MLHWLAGKPHENNEEPDSTGFVEEPQTPAPVFAVRAFKHLVYGTPGTEKPKAPRRHSNTESGRTIQPSRPRMTRPRSTNDATTAGRLDEGVASEPPPSPTKGILMTPGTAGGKRKTVTFPDNVIDNEEKRPTKTGLPEDCPGKFPSPWTKSATGVDHVEDSMQRSGGRSKLTEALEQVRDETTSKRRVRLGGPENDLDGTADLAEPVSNSGKYWKREYDIYRERTTAEVKKLVAKQKLAKNYARDKDDECLELTDELEQERKKVDRLQKRTEDLEAQLKKFQELLKESKAVEASAKDELERIKRGFGTTGYRRPVETSTSVAISSKAEPELKSWRTAAVHADEVVNSTEHQSDLPPLPAAQQPEPTRTRRRPRDLHQKPQDSLWAPSSSLEPVKPEPARPSSRGSRTVTSGTGATPLQTLSINSDVPKETISLAMSMGLQPPISPTKDKRQDSPLQSEEPLVQDESLSIPLPSSPFNPEATMDKPPSSPTAERSARKERQRELTKENVRPTGVVEKPSAAWSAMNATQPVVISTDNKRVKALEIARARLAARGRVVS